MGSMKNDCECCVKHKAIVEALTERDRQIIQLQQENAGMQMRLDNLQRFESVLVSFQQFFEIVMPKQTLR
jgi:hypothetical protein